jgi:hypothetical protein
VGPQRKILIALAALLAGCPRPPAPIDPCAGGIPSSFELRDGNGVLLLALRSAPGTATHVLCDDRGTHIGTFVHDLLSHRPRIDNAAGDSVAKIVWRGGDPALIVGGTTLGLHEENGLLRVLDGEGVPIGQVANVEGKTIVYNPAGQGVATVERVADMENRTAVKNLDGTVRFLVPTALNSRAAGAFALDGLPLAARYLLYEWLETLRLDE